MTPSWLAGHRRAIHTALSLAMPVSPAPLLGGQVFWLGEQGPSWMFPCAERSVLTRFPMLMRPFLRWGPRWEGLDPSQQDADLPVLAGRLADDSPSCLIGPGERVTAFIDEVRQLRGAERIGDLWPDLSTILYTKREAGFDPASLRQRVGDGVAMIEMLSRPEGILAAEDPRLGGFRLLLEHGVYFEFIPAEQAGALYPARLGIDQVRTGTLYELAITSAAGVWACRSNLFVRFLQTAPPLIRLEPASLPLSDAANALVPRAGHRQNAGIPGGLAGTPHHIPWSAPADRG